MTFQALRTRVSSTLTSTLLLGLALPLVAGCAPEHADEATGAEIEGAAQALTTTFTPQAFTMSRAYAGTSALGGSCSVFSPQSLVGHEPAEAGRYPVAIWLTGTLADYAGEGALAFTAAMAQRGFVAASVEYTNSMYGTCSTLKTRASCVFNAASASSAVAKLCARAKADCSKGVVVGGISQGANLATLSKNYDARVRAALAISNVVTPSFYDNTACLKDSATALTPSQLRSISGESDEFMGGISKVRSNLITAGGYSCTGKSCLQADGSGWYIVSDSQVADGKADHCFPLQGGCNGNAGDPVYATSYEPWAGLPHADWLSSRVTH